MVTDYGVALPAPRLHLLLWRRVTVVAGNAAVIEAHELLLAYSLAQWVAAVGQAADVVGVVKELLMRLLRGHLLRLLLLRRLSQVLLVVLAANLLRLVLRLVALLLLVHQLVDLEEPLGCRGVLLLLRLRTALASSDLSTVEVCLVSGVVKH